MRSLQPCLTRRSRTGTAVLAFSVAVLLAGAAISTLCAQEPPTAPPRDTCVLELELPAGARVTVDGRDYGEKRRLTFSGLTPGKDYQSKIVITLPGGKQEERTVTVAGGRTVRLAVAVPPPAKRPLSAEFRRLFEFRDSDPWPAKAKEEAATSDLKEERHEYKPWTEGDKAIAGVLFDVSRAKAPALFDRAAGTGKILLLRQADCGDINAIADITRHALILCDRAFKRGAGQLTAEERSLVIAQTLIHETTHLADRHWRIAWGPAWTAAAGPRLERIHRRYAEQKGASLQVASTKDKADSDLVQKLATEEGLITEYAATSLEEALAEMTSMAVLLEATKPGTAAERIPADVLAVINERLLAPAGAADAIAAHLDRASAAILSADWKGALAAADAVLALDTTLAQAHLQRSRALEALGRPDAAIAALDAAIAHAPRFSNCAELYLGRSRLLAGKHELAGAIADCTKAVDTSVYPFQRLRAQLQRGFLYTAQGAFEPALADLEAYSRAAPNSYLAAKLKGTVLSKRHDYDRALAEFEKALKFAPQSEVAAILAGRGGAWLGKGNAAKALEDLNEALRRDPELVDAYVYRAEIRQRKSEIREAMADLDLAIQKAPDKAAAWFARGFLWWRLLDSNHTIADLTEGLQRDPSPADAYKVRGLARLMKNDRDGTIADFGEFIKRQPDEPRGYYMRGDLLQVMGRQDEAIADYSELVRLTAGDEQLKSLRASGLRGRAISLAAKGEQARAQSDFDEAIAVWPQEARNWFERGKYHSQRAAASGSADEARQAAADLREAIRRDPKSAQSYDWLGDTLFHTGDFAGAIANYDKLIELRPSNENAWFSRGIARYRLGNFDGALADFDQAIKLAPNFARGYELRATVWFAGKHQLDRALADYAAAIKLDPQSWNAYSERGLVWVEKGEFDRAIEDCNRAIELAPKSSFPLYNRGRAWEGKGEYRQALADYDRAIALNAGDSDALAAKARLLAAAGDAALRDGAAAVKLAEKACELTGHKNAPALEALAMAYAETGDFAQAIHWQDAAIAILGNGAKAARERRELYVIGQPYRTNAK